MSKRETLTMKIDQLIKANGEIKLELERLGRKQSELETRNFVLFREIVNLQDFLKAWKAEIVEAAKWTK